MTAGSEMCLTIEEGSLKDGAAAVLLPCAAAIFSEDAGPCEALRVADPCEAMFFSGDAGPCGLCAMLALVRPRFICCLATGKFTEVPRNAQSPPC